MLQPYIFRRLCQLYYTPEVDLFATQTSAQLSAHVSWKPYPSAFHINAFTMNWANIKLYAFPPFCIISRVLEKLQEDEATAVMILPLWPTQVWFPKALRLLAEPPVLLPRNPSVLQQNPALTHTRAQRLVLIAMIITGNLSNVKAFHQMLQNFYLNHGGRAHNSSLGHISQTGCHFFSEGKLILFTHL